MQLTETKLNELKCLETEMLTQFLHICEICELRYYVLGGTLLGAVRHKGFIPWDDDIDVGMPRKDYDVFIQKAQAYLPDPYFLQTYETDPGFPANFAKIRNSNTTFIETSVRSCDMNHGVYIDIFPLDFFPDSKWGGKIVWLQNKLLQWRISDVFFLREKTTIRKIRNAICKALYPTLRGALEKRTDLFKSVRESGWIANYCGAWGVKEIMPSGWYAEGQVFEFEGLKVTGPKEYDKWLTQVYGDYMQLPPIEKRKAHHYADVIDLERPYTEYRKGKV